MLKRKREESSKREHNPYRRRVLFFLLLGWGLLLLGDRVSELRVYQGALIAIYALAIGSLILLTGYSGQLSL
ncbi:MAG: branched-chain amino acid ABC transporter permease, partial [Actinobacteria bacterium]|nr:branched-chain amino acid ABC transporter permease [Actinomycetota bacterium]